jgi:RHS repeat protein
VSRLWHDWPCTQLHSVSWHWQGQDQSQDDIRIRYTDPQGIVTHYDYDANHRLTKITLNYQSGVTPDVDTNVATTLGYDNGTNRLVSLVDPMGFDVGISYGSPDPWTTKVQQLWTNASTTPSSGSSVYQTTTYTAANDGSGAVNEIADAR